MGAETDMDQGLSGLSTSESGGDTGEGPVGGGDSEDIGVVIPVSSRLTTPALRQVGLIEEMEEEVREAGLWGWFNGED